MYVVLETDDGYLFSEFSTEERSARDQKHVDWIKAQEQAAVGHTLLVRVEQKLEWGCICRQEQEPFLEGVILTPETVFKNHLPPQCSVAGSVLHRLTNGSSVSVVITHKRWDNGCYILYFSFPDSSPDVKDG